MACRACSSENQQSFSGELTIAFPGVEKLNQSPVYVCQKTLVCLDCGYSEVVVPAPQLDKLRKGMEGSGPKNKIRSEHSRLQ